MSGVFMDGGNHDAVSHGIDHGGHDHGGHGLHGHGQNGHSFIAQVLGLDQHDHAHLAHHGGDGAGHAPSQTPIWSSALQGLKIENLLAGINITPNFLLMALFAAFTGWLGVIYFIRHHEPFANQVLGSSAAYAPTAGYDRRLINNVRDALPIKTSSQTGLVYTPQPQSAGSMARAGSPANSNLTAAMTSAMGSTPTTVVNVNANTAGANHSPVNQNLSSAMSAALGNTVPNAASAGAAGQAAPAAMGQSMGLSQPMGQSMGMTQPMGAPSMRLSSAGGGAMLGGNARMYSNRGGAAPGFGAPPDSGLAMRLFSSRRAMMAQAQQAPAAPAQPVVDANTWSLANQGSNTFSADTAQFNSQFGAPLK